MAGICFFFEPSDVDVWSGRSIDLDAWNYATKAAGDIDKVIVVNKTNETLLFDADVDFQEVSELPSSFDGTHVYVCCPWDAPLGGHTPLWGYDHNVDWYIFGPASGWHGNYDIDIGLCIPQAGYAGLHAIHIATVVLMHRYGVINGS